MQSLQAAQTAPWWFGAITTLLGVIVGFSITWLKEIWYEKRPVIVKYEFCSVAYTYESHSGSNHIKIRLKLIVQNKSTIAQPIWNIVMFINDTHALVVSNVEQGVTVEAGTILAESRKNSIYEFQWELRRQKFGKDLIKDGEYKLKYRTIQDKVELPLKPKIIFKEVGPSTLKDVWPTS